MSNKPEEAEFEVSGLDTLEINRRNRIEAAISGVSIFRVAIAIEN